MTRIWEWIFINYIQELEAVSYTHLVAFPIQLIFLGIGLTFGAGAGSYISRLLGENNKKEASIVATVALISVSYTHLDVYKRQVQTRMREKS